MHWDPHIQYIYLKIKLSAELQAEGAEALKHTSVDVLHVSCKRYKALTAHVLRVSCTRLKSSRTSQLVPLDQL